MNWAIDIGQVFGIRLRLHYVFLLLLVIVFASGVRSAGLVRGLTSLLFVCGVFVIVALHELGHSLVAMKHGVRVVDITLLPIGGVARLLALPENPGTEIKIALAGPMVNFVLALVALPVMFVVTAGTVLLSLPHTTLGFLAQLYVVNLMMGLFNLIPAFPMDGGRILRAVLAMRWDYVSATSTAAKVGRWIAVAMGGFGLFYNPWLIVLALFLYTAGSQEERLVRARHAFTGPAGPVIDIISEPPPAADAQARLDAEEAVRRHMAEMMWHIRRGR